MDLSHGKIQIRGFGGGVNAGNILVSQPAFSIGVAVSFGFHSTPGRMVQTTSGFYFRL